jgi:hypothetical protein
LGPYAPQTWVWAAAAYVRCYYEHYSFHLYVASDGEEGDYWSHPSLRPSFHVGREGWDLSHPYRCNWLGGLHPRFAEASLLRRRILWFWS